MPNELILNNTISQLILENELIHSTIYKSLKFRDPKYFHAPAYKLFIRTKGKVGWDGYVDFFHKEKGNFATGLLPEITSALDKLKIKVEITDNRSKKIQANEIDAEFMSEYDDRNGKPIVLHDYQYGLANKAWKYERGIIKAATSAGKTLMFTAMVKSIPNNVPVLVLFREKTLATQTYNEFVKFGVKNVGLVHGECFDPNVITCATIQSVHKYEELLSKFEVLIADEVHEFATNESIKVFKKMKKCRYRFGFSATPWDPKDVIRKYRLKSWFGPLLGDISVEELQERNILSDSACYFHKIEKPELEAADYIAAYSLGVMQNDYMHEKIKEIIDSYDSGRHLIVVERIDHGDALLSKIPNALWVQGKDDDETRQFVIDKLSNSKPGEKVVAIASRILSVGVNLFIHSITNAAGFKSYIMTNQRLGRGLRVAEDKTHLDYHDFYFTNNIYLENHSKERIKWLKREGHKIEIK